jgi:predicted small lipoprotein YifL
MTGFKTGQLCRSLACGLLSFSLLASLTACGNKGPAEISSAETSADETQMAAGSSANEKRKIIIEEALSVIQFQKTAKLTLSLKAE